VKGRNTPRVALAVIAALFVLPLLLAWLMYSGAIDWQPASTRNLGQLVRPPLPLSWDGVDMEAPPGSPAERFAGHWLVLYDVPLSCDEVCLEAAVGLRQVHRAAGRHQSRIMLALLLAEPDPATTARLAAVYDAFHLLRDRAGGLRARLAQAAPGAAPGGSYLIDPLGNIMMHYAAGADPNDLKDDLKRLMTWSKLDEQQ
jgi:hypothetical protein